MKILVMRLREMLAPGARFVERCRDRGNPVTGRQRCPALCSKVAHDGVDLRVGNRAHNAYVNASGRGWLAPAKRQAGSQS
jgi:hypothetical protein